MYPNNNQSILSQLSQLIPPKRRVFISYHHQDQAWVDSFRHQFGNIYDVFSDRSLDEAIDSDDLRYVNRAISERHITGTSVTVVLCGTDTWKRKCVDWEIHSTLDKDHALLGVTLPHVLPVWQNGRWETIVPDRLVHNVNSGYAYHMTWPQTPQALSTAINYAVQRSTLLRHTKNNSAQMMTRNRS